MSESMRTEVFIFGFCAEVLFGKFVISTWKSSFYCKQCKGHVIDWFTCESKNPVILEKKLWNRPKAYFYLQLLLC